MVRTNTGDGVFGIVIAKVLIVKKFVSQLPQKNS